MPDTTGNECLKRPIPRLFKDSGPSTDAKQNENNENNKKNKNNTHNENKQNEQNENRAHKNILPIDKNIIIFSSQF